MHISNQLILDLQVASKLVNLGVIIAPEDIADPMFDATLEWLCINLELQPRDKHRQLKSDLSRLQKTLVSYPDDKLSWVAQY